jgi:hypothetical protein
MCGGFVVTVSGVDVSGVKNKQCLVFLVFDEAHEASPFQKDSLWVLNTRI